MWNSCICRQIGQNATFTLIFLSLATQGHAQNYIDVIVDNSLFSDGQIGSETSGALGTYLSDITAQGYTPRLVTNSFANPAALRAQLASDYSTYGIQGAIMIGDMPNEHYETGESPFTTDLFFMDVNGTWTDGNGNGTFDTHAGNVAPEIWISRMITSNLTGLNPDQSESSLINGYLAKSHQYRTGQLRLPQNGMNYCDDDWSPGTDRTTALQASLPGHIDVFNNVLTTTAADYMSRLAPATSPGYESMMISCHSGADGHAFKTNYEWTGGTVYNSDLTGLNPQAFFYNLWACSNVNYEFPGYMGGQYVFGTDMGLLAVGSTKTGSMLGFSDYYNPLGAGKTFGQSFLDWWNAQAAGGFSSDEQYWLYGMTMVGDPLLRPQAFTAAAYAVWNGGTGSWTNQGTNWTLGGSAYTWNNLGTGATFNAPAPSGSIAISGTIYTYEIAVNADGYSFTSNSSDLLKILGGGITANGNTSITCPISVWDSQSWTVASGKTLSVATLHIPNNNNLTIAGAGDTVLLGSIDGSGKVFKNGGGTLTLTNTLNFGGDIAVNAGILNITPAGGAAVTYSGAFTGGGTMVINSTGITSIGGGASNYSGNITLQGGGTLKFIPTTGISSILSGVITGDSSIIQGGAGITVLSNSNLYAGATTVNSGVLQANDGVGLPASSYLSLSGGVLQSNSATTFTRNLSLTEAAGNFKLAGGGFAAGGGDLTVNIGGNATPSLVNWYPGGANNFYPFTGIFRFGSTTAQNVTTFQNPIAMNSTGTVNVADNPATMNDYSVISGRISAITGQTGVGLTKTGTGTLVLTGTNTYNGTTTISSGVLQAIEGVGLPANYLKLSGGVFQSNGTATFTRSLSTTAANNTFLLANGGFAAGSGTLTVNVGNNNQTLTWYPSGSSSSYPFTGTLKFGSTTAGNQTTLVNPIAMSSDGTINVEDNPSSAYDFVVLSGRISNVSGQTAGLIKSGAGILRLSGSVSNTYNGVTTVTGGTLQLAKIGGAIAIPGDLNFNATTNAIVTLLENNQMGTASRVVFGGSAGANLDLNGKTLTVASISSSNRYAQISGGTLTVNNSQDCTYYGSMNGSLVKNSSGILAYTMSSSGSYSINLTVNGGTLDFSSNVVAPSNCSYTITGGTLNLGTASGGINSFQITGGSVLGTGTLWNNGSNPFDIRAGVVSQKLGGSVGGLSKTTTGLAILSGVNSYGGPTTVSQGVLQADNNVGLPNGSYLQLSGTGILQSNSATTFTRNLSLTAAAGNFKLAGGGFAAGGGVLTVNIGGNAIPSLVNWYPAGANNSYPFTGMLRFGSTSAQYATTFQNPIAMYSTGTVNVADNPSNANDYAVISGAISNMAGQTGVGLSKSGTGKLVLTGVNTYNGGTTVSGGTLAAYGTSSGSAIPGAITVNSGGTFSSNGNTGSLHIGTVQTGAATWNNGGNYLFEIFDATNTAGTGWDLWNMAGNLTANSAFNIVVNTESANGTLGLMTDFVNTNSYSWLLASTTGSYTMPTDLVNRLHLNAGGFQNQLAPQGYLRLEESSDYKNLYLRYDPTGGSGIVPVPEPGTLLLLAMGMIGLAFFAKRRS